ncbi:pentatricopeptide repeat-containing protein At2g13600-like [Magnolia sinica]|uniref:pentatricopeptide repeat-containing protein At2g13600-like n=1 Tax=Magnolia sinica TaxID=86752 RepID=UPI00265896F7|nr:pentatricopeptide repeat-containing protein At2g13600-like [Magnolia sinica]XP_058101675.1 pentatricopeptide repeat-containing protein At2g13600-like [Magnolia sinica]XP_058101676.1 pentatricopeptide repeat-containing protein At2g13600-like [Magnolia sinica]XP_058101677.1 pentatricopeptide repeat-containing protein At2g13600-like [Magnolia sinica]XP_058101678.1 pentatricopeptide repeat-containing protein At2g13600-like [Magnolia sinica]
MTKPFLLRSQSKLLTNRCSPLHRCMQQEKEGSVGPDEFALADALKTSAALRSLNHGNQIHAIIVKSGFCRFTVLMTALMDLNLKCSSLPDARRLFDEMSDRDVVSWTSMIVGYVQHQHYDESLGLFKSMVESDTNPNGYSFSGALTACSRLQALRQGKQIHAQVVVSGLLVLESILQNSLLSMYVKCQSLYCAQMLFDLMSVKGIIAWNEMISGYMQCGQGEEALGLLALMVSTGIKPDDFSYAICTNACAALASLSQGSQIHACIVRNGFQSDLVIGNALVDMYAKCGCVDSAKLVFNLMPFKDAVLWTAAISAFGRCGHVEEAIVMFEQMRKLRVKPDKITYLAMLSACSHGGLVDSGWHYFRSMTEGDLIPAEPEHYACMVDILCRRGCLAQALEFIKQMPLKPNIRIWSSFLNSSKMLGDVRLAEFAAAKLLELDPENHSNYVILSNMYAAGNDWKETLKIREKMKSAHTKKEPGCSWVEVKNGIHVFLTADPSHPEMGEILWTLNRLNTCLKDEEHYK